jgi:hypothetical protein
MRTATIAAILLIGATAAGASSTYHRGFHTEPHHGRANISSSGRNVYPSLVRPGAPKPSKPKPPPH